MRCFRDWLSFTTSNQILKLVSNHSMLKLCFEGLESPELNPKASEAIENVLHHVQLDAEYNQEFYETMLLQNIKLFEEYSLWFSMT